MLRRRLKGIASRPHEGFTKVTRERHQVFIERSFTVTAIFLSIFFDYHFVPFYFCSDIIFFGVVASFVAFVFFIINIFPIILPIRSSQTQTSRASIFFHSHFHNSDRLQIFAHTRTISSMRATYCLLCIYCKQQHASLLLLCLISYLTLSFQ